MGISLYNNQLMKDRRRELRHNQTPAENILWQHLRGKRTYGVKFNRQYSIGPYILDFFSPRIRLGIEVDGEAHSGEGGKINDKEREEFLKNQNIQIIRFWNSEVLSDAQKVLISIEKAIEYRCKNPDDYKITHSNLSLIKQERG